MFAVLHIADFALHAVLRTEPGVARRPAALFANTSKKSAVLAANSLARATGVEPGMTAPQAVARCPALVIRTPNPAAENEARAALLAIGFTLSPAIEDTAPGVCTIDVKGLDPKKLPSAVHAAVGGLAAFGLPATAGIARTPLLALYAARVVRAVPDVLSTPSPTGQRAGDDALHDAESSALYSNPPGDRDALLVTDEKNFLAPLPLAAADPPPTLAEVLAHWGLRTLGDLTALPRDEIVRRFGSEGLALWQRASGGGPRPLHPVAPSQMFSAQMEFEQEIETLD
ncbi:MAG: DNA polymerase Y family protein, partial [Opitutaceae bacterium]